MPSPFNHLKQGGQQLSRLAQIALGKRVAIRWFFRADVHGAGPPTHLSREARCWLDHSRGPDGQEQSATVQGLQDAVHLVCRLLLEKKKTTETQIYSCT